jgi:hypothetical protein
MFVPVHDPCWLRRRSIRMDAATVCEPSRSNLPAAKSAVGIRKIRPRYNLIGQDTAEFNRASTPFIKAADGHSVSIGNGLLRNFEPFRPYRQGSSTALVRPIRKPLTMSGVCGRA